LHSSSRGPVDAMQFQPDGRMLAIAYENGPVALVDARTGEPAIQLAGEREASFAVSFSQGGRVLVTEDTAGFLQRWSLPSGRALGRPLKLSLDGPILSLAPNADIVAVSSPDRATIAIFDLATGKRIRTLAIPTEIGYEFAFTPDHRFLVTQDSRGRLTLWSTDTWKPITPKFGPGVGRLAALAISPDGRTVATGGVDGATRLWDLHSGLQLGSALSGPRGIVALDFTSSGDYLMVITGTGQAFRWDVRPSSWARRACEIAGRTLTRVEWSAALPGRDYAPACTR
jgi:WD40 repeat protein